MITMIPREPEVGQLWAEGDTTMRITDVTDGMVKLEDVRNGDATRYRYTTIPRSIWPASLRYSSEEP